MLILPPVQRLGEAEFDTLINGAIKRSIQAFGKLAGFASDDACIPTQYLRMLSVMYYQLDANKIPRGVPNEDYPLEELEIPFACLAGIGVTLPVWLNHVELSSKLIKGIKDHWPDIRQWILYLYRNIIIKDDIAFFVRYNCKSAVLEFLGGLIRDRFLLSWSKSVPSDREIMRVICNLWFMETRDLSFSSYSEKMNTQRESAVFNSIFVIAHETGSILDWGNLLSICRDDAEVMASVSLCHLDHEITRDVLDLRCMAWDLHIITMLSTRENIRLALLRQGTIKAAADVLSLVLSRTWEGESQVAACRCIVNAITFLGVRVEDLDAIPYIFQALDCGLIASLLKCEGLLRFAEQSEAAYQPVRLLGILPGYTVYRSVLRAMVLSIDRAEEEKLDMRLTKGGELYKAWLRFKDAVNQRRMLLRRDIADGHIQTCQNDKCSKGDEIGTFKRCAGCLHAYYCSKKCQRDDWRSGRHKVYCNSVHERFTRTKGRMSSVRTKDLKFLDEVILAEIKKHQERIGVHKLKLHVIELNFVGGAVDIIFDSRQVNPNPFEVKCQCENLSGMRWKKMLDGAKEAQKPLVLVRAFIPGGMARKIMLQAIPLSRILDEESRGGRRRKQVLEPYLINLMYSCCGKESVEVNLKGLRGR